MRLLNVYVRIPNSPEIIIPIIKRKTPPTNTNTIYDVFSPPLCCFSCMCSTLKARVDQPHSRPSSVKYNKVHCSVNSLLNIAININCFDMFRRLKHHCVCQDRAPLPPSCNGHTLDAPCWTMASSPFFATTRRNDFVPFQLMMWCRCHCVVPRSYTWMQANRIRRQMEIHLDAKIL